MSYRQAGCRRLFRPVATRQIGASVPRFPSLFHVGRELSRAATHVDACDGVLSDAGSTPAASTTFQACSGHFSPMFPPVVRQNVIGVDRERISTTLTVGDRRSVTRKRASLYRCAIHLSAEPRPRA